MRRLLVLCAIGILAFPGSSYAAGGPPYEGGSAGGPCGFYDYLTQLTTTCAVTGSADATTGRLQLESSLATRLDGVAPGIGTLYAAAGVYTTEPFSGTESRLEYLFTFDVAAASVDITETSPVSPLVRSFQGEIFAGGSVSYVAEPGEPHGDLTGFTETQYVQYSEGSTGPVTIVARAVIQTQDGSPLPAGMLRLSGGTSVVLTASGGGGSVRAMVDATLRSITRA